MQTCPISQPPVRPGSLRNGQGSQQLTPPAFGPPSQVIPEAGRPQQQLKLHRCSAIADKPLIAALALGPAAPFWLLALLGLWPIAQVVQTLQKWRRGFEGCRPLPGTPESKSLLRSLSGDLKYGLSPQIHREFTGLAERYGGVFHSRVLWAQVGAHLLVFWWIFFSSFGDAEASFIFHRSWSSQTHMLWRKFCPTAALTSSTTVGMRAQTW